jgi:hypothetical protein
MNPRKIKRDNLTARQCERATNWFRVAFGLDSWSIHVDLGGPPPEWVDAEDWKQLGVSSANHAHRTAKVWINRRSDTDHLVTLFHELAHVAVCESQADLHSDDTARTEFLVERIAQLAASSYRAGL